MTVKDKNNHVKLDKPPKDQKPDSDTTSKPDKETNKEQNHVDHTEKERRERNKKVEKEKRLKEEKGKAEKVEKEIEEREKNIKVDQNKHKSVYGQQKIFSNQLNINKVEKHIENNKVQKTITPNVGNKYISNIIKLDNVNLQQEQLFASLNFPDDTCAIRVFRQQIRNEMLKKHKVIVFEIYAIGNDGTKVCRRFVGKFTEDRTGRTQRMLQFLHRDVFNF